MGTRVDVLLHTHSMPSAYIQYNFQLYCTSFGSAFVARKTISLFFVLDARTTARCAHGGLLLSQRMYAQVRELLFFRRLLSYEVENWKLF